MLKHSCGLTVVALEELGDWLQAQNIRPWERSGEAMTLDVYRKISGDQSDLRYASIEAVAYQKPSGEPFVGFRVISPSSAVVFALIESAYVVVIAEFKHGLEAVVVGLPVGNLDGLDDSFSACALRELREETGITVERIQPLGPGFGLNGRRGNTRCVPFLVRLDELVAVDKQPVDEDEQIVSFLLTLKDWIRLVCHGGNNIQIEAGDAAATLVALNALGILSS